MLAGSGRIDGALAERAPSPTATFFGPPLRALAIGHAVMFAAAVAADPGPHDDLGLDVALLPPLPPPIAVAGCILAKLLLWPSFSEVGGLPQARTPPASLLRMGRLGAVRSGAAIGTFPCQRLSSKKPRSFAAVLRAPATCDEALISQRVASGNASATSRACVTRVPLSPVTSTGCSMRGKSSRLHTGEVTTRNPQRSGCSEMACGGEDGGWRWVGVGGVGSGSEEWKWE